MYDLFYFLVIAKKEHLFCDILKKVVIMRRFEGFFEGDKVRLSKDCEHHAKVVRLELNEEVEVLISDSLYSCKVSSIIPLEFSDVKRIEVDREIEDEIVFLCPLLKGDKFEFLLQKSVELGVKKIVPFISSRVIKRITKEEFEKKRARFEKIIFEARLQSNRTYRVVLDELKSYKDALKVSSHNKLIAYEDEALKGELIDEVEGSIAYIVGPEGGFSKEEVELASQNGFKVVSLGKRILRAETAALYGLSVIGYLKEKKHG